jgi:hypothetical protein
MPTTKIHIKKVLVSATISTITEFKQLLKKALAEHHEIRRDVPNCSLSIFINYAKLNELDTAELLAAASRHELFSDNSTLKKFLT